MIKFNSLKYDLEKNTKELIKIISDKVKFCSNIEICPILNSIGALFNLIRYLDIPLATFLNKVKDNLNINAMIFYGDKLFITSFGFFHRYL